MRSGNVTDKVSDLIAGTTYTATGSAVFFGLTSDEWGIIAAVGSLLIAALTAGFNIWFKLKYRKRRDSDYF